MRTRVLLTLVCLGAVAACRPRLDGAPCETSANCPRGQFCSDSICVVGSASGGGTGGGDGARGGGSGDTGGGTATGGGGGTVMGDAGVLLEFNEITAASGRMQGGTITLDLQVGHSTPRTKMTGGSMELTGTAAVQQ